MRRSRLTVCSIQFSADDLDSWLREGDEQAGGTCVLRVCFSTFQSNLFSLSQSEIILAISTLFRSDIKNGYYL
jgi:hypothetical protein